MKQTDWTPTFTYMGRRREAPTSWGQLLNTAGERYSHDSAAVLCEATLSIEEIEFITELRLDPEWHGEAKCGHFTELVSALPCIMEHSSPDGPSSASRFRTQPGMRWIRELVAGFIPRRMEHTDELSQDPAEWFVTGNYGPALTILHLLMMRSDYWPLMFAGDMSPSELTDLWDMPDPKETFTQLYMIAGDPFNLPAKTGGKWDTSVFSRRLSIFWEYVPISMRPLLADLDLLARIAASTSPELKHYITAYDQWRDIS